MGKGKIISGGSGGEYQVELSFDRRRVNSEQFGITQYVAQLTAEIAAMDEGLEKDLKTLHKTALEKREELIQADMPADPTVAAWCTDLTEDLSGTVGTIEVPGERGTVLIQPGYAGSATYDSDRDGILQPSLGGTPESVFFNWSLRPGWQKWMPTYRFGTIIAIAGDNCDIRLFNAQSSDQGLQVNQTTSLTNVAIEYMDCNGAAFSIGDEVVIKFEGQNWDTPKVIGFKDNPQACAFYIRLTIDGHDLYYGGQKISITYYSEIEEQEITSPTRTIHGGGDDYDSEKHGLAGPFILEGWNTVSNLKINLYKERAPAAISINPAPIVQKEINSTHYQYYDGINNMFEYFIEAGTQEEQEQDDDVRVWHFVSDFDNWPDPDPPTASLCPGQEFDPNPPDPDQFIWTVNYNKSGLTEASAPPFIIHGEYFIGTQWYRKIYYIYDTIDPSLVSKSEGAETVYNWTINEYESATVWDLNINYNLKQIHYNYWRENLPHYFPSGSPDVRVLEEYYSNLLEIGTPNWTADYILSIPWVTYHPPDRPLFCDENVVGSYPFDSDGDSVVDTYSCEDWDPAEELTTGSGPILIVTDEADLTPTPAYTLSGITSKERWTKTDENCAQYIDDEMEQLVESTNTLEYWY
jgi:hypothetical protein